MAIKRKNELIPITHLYTATIKKESLSLIRANSNISLCTINTDPTALAAIKLYLDSSVYSGLCKIDHNIITCGITDT